MTPRRRTTNLDLPRGVYRHHGHYRMRVYDANGKPGWRSLGKEKTEALKQWAQLVGEPQSGQMALIIDRYVAEVLPTKAPATQRSYRRQAGILMRVFGEMKADAITSRHIARYLDQRSSPIQANREVALLSAIFTKAVRWGLVDNNPCRGVERNKERARDRYVTDAELRAAMRRAPRLVRRAMWLAYLTGLRRGDVLRLTRFNVTAEGVLVTESKTRKRVLIAWSPSLQKCIKKLTCARPDGPLFPISASGFDTAWQRLMRNTPFERFQMKDLRAKHASDFAETGGDATAQLGHSQRGVTVRHYLRRPRRVIPIR